MSATSSNSPLHDVLAIVFALFYMAAAVFLWYYIDYCEENYDLLWNRFSAGEDVNFWAPYRWLGLVILAITGGIIVSNFLIHESSFTLLLSLAFMFYGFLILTDLPKLIFNARITFRAARGPLHFYCIAISCFSIFTIITSLTKVNKDLIKQLMQKFKKKPIVHNDILDHFEEEEK